MKTRYHFLHIYLPGLILLVSWISLFRVKTDTNAVTVLFLILSVFTGLFLLIVNGSPRLSMNGDSITARFLSRTESKLLTDISLIEPNSRERRWFIDRSFCDCCIRFTDGSSWLMVSFSYANLGDFLKPIFERIPDQFNPPKNFHNETSTMQNLVYRGNLLTSIYFLAPMIFFPVTVFANHKSLDFHGRLFILIVAVAGFWALCGNLMYYFEIRDDALIIRNFFFRWYYRQFSMDKIFEINTVPDYWRSTTLKITTTDFTCKFYASDLLRSKDWNDLLSNLEAAGLSVQKG